MLQSPEALLLTAIQGHSLPAFAYVSNNPIAFTDSTGDIPDSIRMKMLVMVDQVDISGAIAYYQLANGPRRSTGSAGNAVSICGRQPSRWPVQQVAKDVAKGFEFLGQKPQFVALRAKAYDFMSCDLPDETSLPVIRNGYHVVARGCDRIYDAFTGPAGMTVADYMARLQARYDFDWSVVATP